MRERERGGGGREGGRERERGYPTIWLTYNQLFQRSIRFPEHVTQNRFIAVCTALKPSGGTIKSF